MTIHESQPQQTTIDAFGKENKKKVNLLLQDIKKNILSALYFFIRLALSAKIISNFFSFSPPRETNGEGTWEKKNQQPLKQKRKPALERKRSPLLTHDLGRPSSRWKLNFNLDSVRWVVRTKISILLQEHHPPWPEHVPSRHQDSRVFGGCSGGGNGATRGTWRQASWVISLRAALIAAKNAARGTYVGIDLSLAPFVKTR